MKKNSSPSSHCPLCGYAQLPLCADAGVQEEWVRCSRKLCGHIQRSRQIPSEYAAPVFLDYDPAPTSLWQRLKGTFESSLAFDAKDREHWEGLYLPDQPGHLLDIGAGDLRWVEKATTHGWTTESVHSNLLSVKSWQPKGLTITYGTPQWDSYPMDAFDAVLLRWALEQYSDPVDFLKKAWRVLKPGGRLVIIAWNSSSLGRELYGNKWLPLCIPQHFHIFSPGSLHKCFRLAGINEKFVFFSSFAGQLPQAFQVDPSTEDQGELRKKASKLLKETPLCGEALVLACNKIG